MFVPAFGRFDPTLCSFGGAVAMAYVSGERVAVGVPVEVVGVLAHERVDCVEGALDWLR